MTAFTFSDPFNPKEGEHFHCPFCTWSTMSFGTPSEVRVPLTRYQNFVLHVVASHEEWAREDPARAFQSFVNVPSVA